VTPLQLGNRQKFALNLARDAGEQALRYLRGQDRPVIAGKSSGGIVTEADMQLESTIRRQILSAFPDDAIIGEEQGGQFGDRVWIVDPIDGSTNYARRLPHWCISIAFLLQGTPVLGVIYAPRLNEMFSGQQGEGATLNGRPLRCSDISSLTKAAIAFGLAGNSPSNRTAVILRSIAALGTSVRIQGAGALTLAYVAAGRLDGFYEANMHIWDCAAAIAIMAECGCKYAVEWNPAAPEAAFPILAGAPGIWEQFVDCVGATLNSRSLVEG
jgi:myo-inositol-1(or 4)-monophosphatase